MLFRSPVKWKVLKYNDVSSALYSSKNIIRRQFIYRLVTEPGFFTEKTEGWGGSRDTVKSNIVKFCQKISRKKRLSECDFIKSVDDISI